MEDLWMMYGGFMEDIGRFKEDSWKIYRGFMEDL